MSDGNDIRQLPLKSIHETAGARFGPFAGWSMPLTYPLGVMKEHLHTRAHCGLFDISHMKLVALGGPDAEALLAKICPVDPAALGEGRSKLSFLLNDNAGIIDDLIVTRLGDDRFMVVANAGNAAGDIEHMRKYGEGLNCTIEPLDRVFLALQGPDAEAVLKDAGIDASDLYFMQGREPKPGWFLTRSGYTGEDGFEIGAPADEAATLAETLTADERCEWIGLAARDSLRLEAGLCLHGQDIDPETNPAEAVLMWAIPKALREGGEFVGADALRKALAEGASKKRVGLKPEGRQPVRAGAELFDGDGNPAGKITSGGFGPSAGHPVAMGYVRADLAKPGTALFAEVRGNRLPVQVHALPFTPHRYRKG